MVLKTYILGLNPFVDFHNCLCVLFSRFALPLIYRVPDETRLGSTYAAITPNQSSTPSESLLDAGWSHACKEGKEKEKQQERG